jgi:hypothetical protein
MTPVRSLSRGVAAAAAVIVATAVGLGWLYLLRESRLLDTGPSLAGALPLQRLAHGDAQPLGRLTAAWVPAGVVAGLALGALTALPRVLRAAAVGLGAWVVLVLTAAASVAVTESERFGPHLVSEPRRAAPWIAAGLVAAGSLIAPHRRRGRAREADATRLDSTSAWAA